MSTPSTVKSWCYTTAGYPETLKVQDTQVPSAPEPHHVLVLVKAASLNPVDIQLMNLPINSLPRLNVPKTAGRDFAGVILAAAPGTGFEKGDEIMGVTMTILDGSGTLAEATHIDLRSSCVVRKPKGLSWEQAASLPLVWLTAYTAVEKCAPFLKAPLPGDNRIVVLGGSSSTGIYTVWLARRRGWRVMASCSGRNAEFVRERGADEVVDYTASEEAVTNAVGKFRPGAIVDCVGGTDCIGLAPQYVTIVGDKTSRATMGGSVLYLWYPRMFLRWFVGWLGLGKSYECIVLEQKKEWLQEVAELKEDEIVVDSVFDFGKVKEAYGRLNTSRARGKIVVTMGN